MKTNYLKFFRAIFLVLLLLLESLMFASSWKNGDPNISCIVKERQALLELKQGFVDNYGRLSSWGEDGDCCKWSGIHCNNQSSHVEVLDLGDYEGEQALVGEISASLLHLQDLIYLDLSFNDFDLNEIPAFFGSLTKLRYLDLSFASFGGKIPCQLGKLSSLQFLSLQWNYLVGEIPYQLGNLSSLQILELHRNKLGGIIPYQLGNLSSLYRLSLGENDNLKIGTLNSANADWISQLSSLKILDLTSVSSPNKSKSWIRMVAQLPKLERLYLENCSLSDMDILPLSTYQLNFSTSLTLLSLYNNKFTSSIFTWLFNLSSNLAYLQLDQNLLEGAIPDNFGNAMQSLVELTLSDNQLNGMIPKSFGLMSHLQCLDIAGNSLKGVVTDTQFANLTKLSELSLSYNSLKLEFSDKWIPPFQLQDLVLQSCKVGPAFPKWLETQNNLMFLDLSNTGISDTARVVSFLCTSGESLILLDMSNNHLTGQIPNCWSHLKSLRILDTSNNAFSRNIPDSMGSLVQIRHVVQRNNKLTGKLPSLENCTELVLLDVGGNELWGPLPPWIGSTLHHLEVLSMRKNHFYGSLPLSLCHLTGIQVLDLKQNNFSGEIPKCLKNFSSMIMFRMNKNEK